MSFASLICKFDTFFIAIAAVINIAVLIVTRKKIIETQKMIEPEINRKFRYMSDLRIDNKLLCQFEKKKKEIVTLYSVYANIIAIFPLLGILGTVASLITISGDSNMMDNLMVALDTTLYGVFAAIIFKVLDALLSGPIDSISDDYIIMTQNYLDQNEKDGGKVDEE